MGFYFCVGNTTLSCFSAGLSSSVDLSARMQPISYNLYVYKACTVWSFFYACGFEWWQLYRTSIETSQNLVPNLWTCRKNIMIWVQLHLSKQLVAYHNGRCCSVIRILECWSKLSSLFFICYLSNVISVSNFLRKASRWEESLFVVFQVFMLLFMLFILGFSPWKYLLYFPTILSSISCLKWNQLVLIQSPAAC